MKKILSLLTLIIATQVYSYNAFQKELKGKWKMQKIENQNHTDINLGEFQKFIDNEIHFFELESGKEKEKSIEKITFIYNFGNQHYNSDCCQLIKFENGEVWELTFRLIKDETRLIWKLMKNKDYDFIFQIDHRGSMKDLEARKKTLEGDVNTYYTKIK